MEQGIAAKKPIKVAIIGVGNCASSLVRGVTHYKDAPEDQRVPGLMHVTLGGYHVRDIRFTDDEARRMLDDYIRARGLPSKKSAVPRTVEAD